MRALFKTDVVHFSPTTIVKEVCEIDFFVSIIYFDVQVGDNWFVTFSNEQEALDALNFIRKQKVALFIFGIRSDIFTSIMISQFSLA